MARKPLKLKISDSETSSGDETIHKKSNKSKNNELNRIPKGKPKSGRIWKGVKTKFSSIIKTKGIRNSLEKKQQLRADLKRVKQASREILAAKQDEIAQRKQRRRENLKRLEENRKKSEIVQVINNTSKIKKMKKKQLRYIEKRDTTKVEK